MRSLLLVSATLALGASVAQAQSSSPYANPSLPPPPPPRAGLELGVGLQVGEISCESQEGDFCDDFTEAGGLNLSLAYFFNPRIGIALDLWGMSHTEDDFTFSHVVNTIGLRWRPLSILTLGVGVGSAHARLEFDGVIDATATSEDAFAVLLAAGIDVIRGRSWALSVEARLGAGFYGDEDENGEADVVGRNAGLGAAFTFFGF